MSNSYEVSLTRDEWIIVMRALRKSQELLGMYPSRMSSITPHNWAQWYHSMEDAEEVRCLVVQRILGEG